MRKVVATLTWKKTNQLGQIDKMEMMLFSTSGPDTGDYEWDEAVQNHC